MKSCFFVCVQWFILSRTILAWHAYNESLKVNLDPKCGSFQEKTKPLHSDIIEKMHLWPNLMKYSDIEHGETLFGFEDGLNLIWKNQFPEDCSKAKFLVSGGWPYGFGSRVHIEGAGLAMAMQMGRVYLPHPDGDNIFWETQVPFCRDRNELSLECYYEPWSSCTIQDAVGVGGDINHFPTVLPQDLFPIFESPDLKAKIIENHSQHKTLNIVFTASTNRGAWSAKKAVPDSVLPIIECAPLYSNFTHYWWRAVAAAFVLRPNIATLNLLTTLHTLPLTDRDNCIAMFVRHGDKGIEMELIPFETYVQTAKLLASNGLVKSNLMLVNKTRWAAEPRKHGIFNGTIFLSTDDPDVITAADKWGSENGWKMLYTNLFDRGQQTARLDWAQQHKKGTHAVHDDLEYVSMLLNLEYSVQCEAWVCTLASNSCRLIDEIRATIGAKANRAFADLSKESCSTPPCIGSGIYDIGE